MKYKLLLLDIDGTLRPGSCERVPKENAEAVCAVQKAGVKIAIATGRGRIGVGKGLLRSIRPDYWVCAGGAQLVDYKGADLALHRLTTEEMYALVDFFEDYDLPLRFTYHDANYAYLGYEEFARREREKNLALNIVDGEDQDKHLEEMPFGAFGFLSQEMADRFQEKYGYLGLNFLFSYPGSDGCDILQRGIDKGAGLRELAKLAGIDPADCVAVGDGDNDVAMLGRRRASALPWAAAALPPRPRTASAPTPRPTALPSSAVRSGRRRLNGRVHPCRPRSAAAARCAGQRADLRQLSQPQEPGAGLFLRPQAEPLLADDRRRDR